MYSLLVTIIAIALVALVALATLYYGGTIFNTGAEAAHAAKLDAQGQQVMGALELYKADTGAYPHTMEDLVTSQYLRSIPVSLSPDTQALASALASTTTWLIAADGQPVIVTQPVSVATCSAFNKLNLGVAGVLAAVHSSALRQCYGTDSANLTVLISKSGVDTLYVSTLPAPAVSIGNVLTTPVPPASDTTTNGWSIFPGAAAPAAPALSYTQNSTGISVLVFGSSPIGSTSTPLVVMVKNTGTVAAALTGATVAAPFAVSNNTCIGVVAAGASCSVAITFTPGLAQAYTGGAYVLTLTASNGTLATLPLTGAGTPAGVSASEVVSIVSTDTTYVRLTNGKWLVAGINEYGQLGLNNRDSQYSFVESPSLQGAIKVVATYDFTLAQFPDGHWAAAGTGAYGVLSSGNMDDQLTFVTIPALQDAVQVQVHGSGDVAIFAQFPDGHWAVAGSNVEGELGIGSTSVQSTFVTVPALQGIQIVLPTMGETLAKTGPDSWAIAGDYMLAAGRARKPFTNTTFTPQTGLNGYSNVVTDGMLYLAQVAVDGTWRSAGSGVYGRGTGAAFNSNWIPQFTMVSSLDGADKVLIGDGSYFAHYANDSWAAAGANFSGEMGLGNTTPALTFVPLSALSGVQQLTAGGQITFAKLPSGSWVAVLDRGASTEDFLVDYRECPPTQGAAARLVILGAPKGITPGVAEFTVFGDTAKR